MKRLLFAISMMVCSFGLSAQTYNISKLYPAATTSPTSQGDFRLLNADGTTSVIASTRTFGSESYTMRLRLNGAVVEDEATGLPVSRAVAIPVTGEGSVELAVLPVGIYGSIEDADAQTSNTVSYTFEAADGSVTKGSADFVLTSSTSDVQKMELTTEAGTLYLYSTTGGLNLYMVRYTPNNATGLSQVTPVAEVVSSEYITLTGAQISHPTPGIYLRRVRLADGKVRVEKVVVR